MKLHALNTLQSNKRKAWGFKNLDSFFKCAQSVLKKGRKRNLLAVCPAASISKVRRALHLRWWLGDSFCLLWKPKDQDLCFGVWLEDPYVSYAHSLAMFWRLKLTLCSLCNRSWTNHCCGFKIKRLFKPPLAQPQLWASVYLYWLSNNRYTDCAQQIRIKIAKLEKILAQNRFEYERE